MAPRKVVFNAVSAKMGGAVNYLRTVVAELSQRDLPFEVIIWVPSAQAEALRSAGPRFRIVARDFDHLTPWERLEFDQWTLRKFIREEGADVLFSTANVGMMAAPIRQILLLRNSLYFSPLYRKTILAQKSFGVQMQEQARRTLTLLSVQSADVVMTPSQTLRDELLAEQPRQAEKVIVNPYGVELNRFTNTQRPVQASGRLLFTSLYAEHKNLTTALTAIERLEGRGIPVSLTTTADPRRANFQSPVQADDATRAQALEARGLFSSPGALPPDEMASLYRQADVFLYPSVVESFGHPLVEAMAAGLPIVASDTPINRELCQGAALYFSPFDADACANQIERLLQSAGLREALMRQGYARARAFTWSAHVDRLLGVLVG